MYRPGGNADEIYRQITGTGPYQILKQTACREGLIGYSHHHSDQTLNLPSLPSERCGWTIVKELLTDKESTDTVVSEDKIVWVPASEFQNRQSLFELDDCPVDHSLPVPRHDEIDGCKVCLMGLLEAIYEQKAASWLQTFTMGEALICTLDPTTLRNAECQDEECKVAVLFILMIQAQQSGIRALWLAMAKFGWKLVSVCSLKIQHLITSISKILSEISNKAEIQEFLRSRNKTAQMTIEMSDQLLQDVRNEELERMKFRLNSLLKFDMEVRTAFRILHADARLIVNTWDNFSIQERLQAGAVACHIIKQICVLSDHQALLHAVNKLWKIMEAENQNAGRLDVICVSVYKLKSEQWGGSHDICVVEWLASPSDLCSRITKESVLQFLEMDKLDADERNFVLLPFCNASDYNELKINILDDVVYEKEFKKSMGKRIRQAECLFENVQVSKKTTDPGVKALLVFAAFSPHNSRFISPERVTSNPKSGICFSKNINLVRACRNFNAPGCLDLQPGFERSNHLYPAQQLAGLMSVQASGMEQGLFMDRLQSSFDSFCWFSNVFNGKIGKWNSRSERLSPRLALTAVNSSNAESVLKSIVTNWRMKAAVGVARACVQRGRRDARVACDPNIPDTSDLTTDDLSNGDEVSAINSSAMGTGLYFGRDQDLPSSNPDPHDTSTIVKCLSDNSVVRYVQVDFNLENQKNQTQVNADSQQRQAEVNSITYMVILPDVQTSKKTKEVQVCQNPISMFVAHHPTKGGRYVYCSCPTFANNFRSIKSNEEGSFETYELWFFHSFKCRLFHERRAGDFCIHTKVKNEFIINTFFNEEFFTWHAHESKIEAKKWEENPSWQNYKHSCIAFTAEDGFTSLGDNLFQSIPIVSLNMKSSWISQSREGKSIYSVDCCVDKRHAFVKVFSRRFMHDASPENERQEQMYCDQCSSRLHSNGYEPCEHIMAVYKALYGLQDSDNDQDLLPEHTSASKREQSGYYDPKLVNTECDPDEAKTGYVYNGTYTRVQHRMDVVWRKILDKLCFGDLFSRAIAAAKNKILDDKQAIVGEHYSYFEVDEGEILSAKLPLECPRCGQNGESKKVKTMTVLLHMSDQKLVRSPVKYWVCSCRFCVHNDGFEDGFWFINLHLAVSTQCLWDLLDHQMEGSGMDFATYCKVCNAHAKTVNRDIRNKFINRNRLSDVYFAFFSRVKVRFNQGCYGCILEAKGFPSSSDHSDIQKWSENAPPSSRDISCVGMDGLSRFFAKDMVFKKKAQSTKECIKKRASLKPKKMAQVTGKGNACLNRSKPFPTLHDRNPIPTGGQDSGSSTGYQLAAAASKAVRQCAMTLRKGFIALGDIIKGTISKKNWYFEVSGPNLIQEQINSLAIEIRSVNSRQQSLLHPLKLADVCSDPISLYNAFGLVKTERLMKYVGMFMRQIGANNSVVALLKYEAIDMCSSFCKVAMNTESDTGTIIHHHVQLVTFLTSKPATPSLAADSLCVLLDYFRMDADRATSTIQMQLNRALCESLLFVAERTREVFILYGLNKGYLPHPVRAPGDHWTEFPNDVLKIKESQEPSNPVTDHGAYYFTKNGAKLRDLPKDDSRFDAPEDGNDCRKPGFKRDRKAGRAAGKRMVFCVYCVLHGIFMGYHIIFGSEGRKDPFYAMYVFKPTAPHSTSYDFSCG